jgi:hypothetical protein
MCNEHIVRLFAGIVVLLGIALAHYVADYWIFLSIFMGVNLVQSAFTGICPLELILKRCRKK